MLEHTVYNTLNHVGGYVGGIVAAGGGGGVDRWVVGDGTGGPGIVSSTAAPEGGRSRSSTPLFVSLCFSVYG